MLRLWNKPFECHGSSLHNYVAGECSDDDNNDDDASHSLGRLEIYHNNTNDNDSCKIIYCNDGGCQRFTRIPDWEYLYC